MKIKRPGVILVLLAGMLAVSWKYLLGGVRGPTKAGPLPAAVASRSGDEAAVVAKIAEWVEDPVVGSFAALQIIEPMAVKTKTVLLVRRGKAIIGMFKVTAVAPEGAVADPIAIFDELKPEVGDELIVGPAAP